MEPLKCKMCGNAALEKDGEFFVCRYCGTKYPEKIKMEFSGEVNIQGIENYNNLINNGNTFLILNEYQKAINIFEKAISIYPDRALGYAKLIIAKTKYYKGELFYQKNEIDALYKKMRVVMSLDNSSNNEDSVLKVITNYEKIKLYLLKIEKLKNEEKEKKQILNTIKEKKQRISEDFEKAIINNKKTFKSRKDDYYEKNVKKYDIDEDIAEFGKSFIGGILLLALAFVFSAFHLNVLFIITLILSIILIVLLPFAIINNINNKRKLKIAKNKWYQKLKELSDEQENEEKNIKNKFDNLNNDYSKQVSDIQRDLRQIQNETTNISNELDIIFN